jgi:hypothetical protein
MDPLSNLGNGCRVLRLAFQSFPGIMRNVVDVDRTFVTVASSDTTDDDPEQPIAAVLAFGTRFGS